MKITYTDNGTTSHIIHETAKVLVPGMIAGYYLSVLVEAVTPVGTPLSAAPVFVSLDFYYKTYINRVVLP